MKKQVSKRILSLLLSWTLLAGFAVVATSNGCKKNVHPGAVSIVDSNAYDTLLIAQAAIDEGRRIITEHNTAEYRSVFNKAVAVYNQAEADWQLYHSMKDPALEAKLQAEISDVVKTIAAMRTAFGKKVGQ